MRILILAAALIICAAAPATAEEANEMNQATVSKPAERPWMATFILVQDIEAALSFYEDVFGLERGQSLASEDGRVFHAEMNHQGQAILMMGPVEGAEGTSGYGPPPASGGAAPSFNFYFYLADVDGPAASAAAAGGTVIQEPRDEFWGDRTALIRDRDGYLWMIAKQLGAAGAED